MRLATNLAAALTASFLILATSPAALASTHETTADLAEQSRMLAPRATKAYLMVQQGIDRYQRAAQPQQYRDNPHGAYESQEGGGHDGQ